MSEEKGSTGSSDTGREVKSNSSAEGWFSRLSSDFLRYLATFHTPIVDQLRGVSRKLHASSIRPPLLNNLEAYKYTMANALIDSMDPNVKLPRFLTPSEDLLRIEEKHEAKSTLEAVESKNLGSTDSEFDLKAFANELFSDRKPEEIWNIIAPFIDPNNMIFSDQKALSETSEHKEDKESEESEAKKSFIQNVQTIREGFNNQQTLNEERIESAKQHPSLAARLMNGDQKSLPPYETATHDSMFRRFWQGFGAALKKPFNVMRKSRFKIYSAMVAIIGFSILIVLTINSFYSPMKFLLIEWSGPLVTIWISSFILVISLMIISHHASCARTQGASKWGAFKYGLVSILYLILNMWQTIKVSLDRSIKIDPSQLSFNPYATYRQPRLSAQEGYDLLKAHVTVPQTVADSANSLKGFAKIRREFAYLGKSLKRHLGISQTVADSANSYIEMTATSEMKSSNSSVNLSSSPPLIIREPSSDEKLSSIPLDISSSSGAPEIRFSNPSSSSSFSYVPSSSSPLFFSNSDQEGPPSPANGNSTPHDNSCLEPSGQGLK